MARITRKELKTDKFALEVEHTVTFFEEHQKEIVRYGIIAAAVILAVVGYGLYSRSRGASRAAALAQAIQVQEAPVSTGSLNGGLSFPTQQAKDAAAIKVFTNVKNDYSGSAEAQIAQYYLGSIAADQGKMAEAEKTFQELAEKGNAQYSSLAKLSLAQVYFVEGRVDQAEKILRDVMAHPTVFVSSDQAALTLARYLVAKNPAEARKLLEPLRAKPGAVGQVAVTLYGDLQQQ